MLVSILLLLTSVFLALNMGAGGFTVSFTPSYASNILTKNKAVLFYILCVFLGGVLIGPRVVNTLLRKISGVEFSLLSGVIILGSCAFSIFLSNLLKVPQSSSFVTAASFVGAGLYYRNVDWYTVFKILIFALMFSVSSFFLTIFIKRKIYPPHKKNIRLYENFFIHREKFRKFIIFTNIYAAFGIGTNNVANVVAPLMMSLGIRPFLGFLLISPLFGLGAYLLGGRIIQSVSKEIVPVGEFSASIISLISATLAIIASLLGLPTPYVQFTLFSLLGISCVKDGLSSTVGKSVVRKIFWVWMIIPLFSVFLSFILHVVFS